MEDMLVLVAPSYEKGRLSGKDAGYDGELTGETLEVVVAVFSSAIIPPPVPEPFSCFMDWLAAIHLPAAHMEETMEELL